MINNIVRKRLPLFLGVLIIFGLWLAAPVLFNETISGQTTTWSQVANAQVDGGVVSCGPGTSQRECDICGLFETGYNIIRLGFFLIAPIVVLMIIIGGIMYITSAGYEDKVGTAKKTLTGAIIGLVIIFVSYAAVKAITTAFGYSENILAAVDCSQFEGTVVSGETVTEVFIPSDTNKVCDQFGFEDEVCTWAALEHPQGVNGLVNPTSLSVVPNRFLKPTSKYSVRYLKAPLLNSVQQLESLLSDKGYSLSTGKGDKTWRITEVYPPTRRHVSDGHYTGDNFDIAIYPATKENYDALWAALKSAGIMNPYNESSFDTQLMGVTHQSDIENAHLHAAK
ncbi:hypothetical protein ACFL1U_02660 [Patescibacteria group bacterium]